MRYLQVYTAAVIVVVCLCLAVTHASEYRKFNDLEELRNAVKAKCCTSAGKREINDHIHLKTSSEAKRFLSKYRGLYIECCNDHCNHEEVREGSTHNASELGEECVYEGCASEEIREHC